MSDKNQGIYDNVNQFINETFNINKLYIYSIVLICILYILTQYNKTIELINNEYARIGLLILIGFIASNNIYVGFIMTLILLAIMQIVTYKNIDNEIEIITSKINVESGS
jgi:hypothetical protein